MIKYSLLVFDFTKFRMNPAAYSLLKGDRPQKNSLLCLQTQSRTFKLCVGNEKFLAHLDFHRKPFG
ncbi:MAG: hypothetical protein V7K97_29805 [Nostoc sp.]|uniref:hypothetical protein n=1 Tax=Nostoc sp. TaxID=1180 RepID=UPI002FF93EA1